jgi:hypothetical protein
MRRAGKRGRTQRRLVQPRAAVGHAAAVAAEHLHVGHQVMAEGDGLCRLQMGEARHDRRGVFVGAVDQRRLQVGKHRLQAVDRVAHPQADIERDLVVARARRVQAPAGRADEVGQPALDVEMDVLELGRELEAAGLDLLAHPGQPSLDGAAVLGREDALGDQHVAVGDRARDILRVEPAVEPDGGVDLLHDFRRAELVAAAPHRVGLPLRRSRSRVLPCHEYEPVVL